MTFRMHHPSHCRHDAPWRNETLSNDGKTRYGFCELCKSWVSQKVAP